MFGKKVVGGISLGIVSALCLTVLMLAAPADTPVADAAMNSDMDALRTLLRTGTDVNAAQGDGMTALHWASYKDDVEMAQMLTYAGANVRATTRINGMTPLILAARNGSGAMVSALLAAGADSNGAMTIGTTPLMLAAASGDVESITALLEHGAEVDSIEDAQGQTALMFAASYNRDEAISVLIEHGADVSLTTKTVDLSTRTRGRGGAAAAASGRGRGAPGARGRGRGRRGAEAAPPPPLSSASGLPASSAPGSVVRTPTAAPEAQGRGRGQQRGGGREGRLTTLGGLTPLLFAARQGHLDAVKALLESGADINQLSPGELTSPILIATINGHFDLAMFLLNQEADPTLASKQGATPLYVALNVRWGPETGYPQPDVTQNETSYLELMQALIDHGADVDAQLTAELWYTGYTFDLSRVNAAGATPFWRAAQVVDLEGMKLLIDNGADPELANNDDALPIHVANGSGVHGNDEVIAPTGWLAGVRYLVEELGADVNARDGGGLVPLHHAAAIGENELVRYLVANGADVTVVAENGRTVADMANGPRQRIQPYPDTIALLISLGSPFNDNCVSC